MSTATDARFWDRMARKYAASPIEDMAGYERTIESTRAHLRPEHVAFEFGCGTGMTAVKLAPSVARLISSDISGEMIAIARERAEADGVRNVEFVVATPDQAPWPDASFDVALGFNILHLVEARTAALASVHRMLKPGGLFISKTPCLKEMNSLLVMLVPLMRMVGQAPYVAKFTAQELEAEIAAAGFDIVERARHGSKRKDPRIFLVARKR